MTGGVATALDEALDAEASAEDLVQAVLFEDLDETETGSTTAPSPLSALLAAGPKSKGRPRGSKNRRTEAVVAWLLAQHRHPLSVMMEAYSMTPRQLADAIGLGDDVDLLEVFKLQMRMAEAVAPYVAQRLPQAVQIDAKGSLSIAFEGVALPARGQAPGPGAAIDGDALGLKLPFKSDEESRTDG